MGCGCRRRWSLSGRSERLGRSGLSWLLALLGLGWFLRSRQMSQEERAELREKGKAFRTKLREAWAVWEDEAEPPVTPDEQA